MRSFILLTFLFIGLGYYELSGGGDFVPETQPGAPLAAAETAPQPDADVVTRDDTADAADVNALPGVPVRLARPVVTEQAQERRQDQAEVQEAVADAIAAALAAPAPDLPLAGDAPVLVSLVAPDAAMDAATDADAGQASATGAGTGVDTEAAPGTDWRQVDASSLNVRAGPSTGDSVVARLTRDAAVQVLSELDDGWSLIRIGDAGTEGWVASRFLAP